MGGKDLMVIAGAAVAVLLLLRYAGGQAKPARYWVSNEGNTAYPAEAVPQVRGVAV